MPMILRPQSDDPCEADMRIDQCLEVFVSKEKAGAPIGEPCGRALVHSSASPALRRPS
jgi:hypothetical protein